MDYFNENNKVKQLLLQNMLSVPGVASVALNSEHEPDITIVQENLKWIVNMNINCFSYVNIWSVIRQVQAKSYYTMEKLLQHKEAVEVNVNVFEIITENN